MIENVCSLTWNQLRNQAFRQRAVALLCSLFRLEFVLLHLTAVFREGAWSVKKHEKPRRKDEFFGVFFNKAKLCINTMLSSLSCIPLQVNSRSWFRKCSHWLSPHSLCFLCLHISLSFWHEREMPVNFISKINLSLHFGDHSDDWRKFRPPTSRAAFYANSLQRKSVCCWHSAIIIIILSGQTISNAMVFISENNYIITLSLLYKVFECLTKWMCAWWLSLWKCFGTVWQ